MTNWIIYAALLLYVAFDATGQGKFAWLSREWVPPTAQAKVSFSLHVLYPAKYALVAGLLVLLTHWWPWLLVAGLLRLAVFDPVFAWSRGDTLWSLGTSAWLDRLLGRVPFLNPFLRGAALLGSVVLLLL
jgi:hypothetical protein